MGGDEVLIRVERISKKFCASGLKRSLWLGVLDITRDLLRRDVASRGLRGGEFWALDNVSFEIRRGECLGLIGRNGAGKTTLLKLLYGLLKPDHGRIETRGRVGALIALGAAFNPVLTGRENIYINGSLIGFTRREIDGMLDDIIDFAEIGDFIDAPLQNYSSGMQVRLGFAVMTAQRPDILLIDEVLAIGDARFRQKCYARISRMMSNAAVIFVSHSMEQVGHLCAQSLLLDCGRVLVRGPTSDCIRLYDNLSMDAPSESFLSLDNRIASATIHVSESVTFGTTVEVRLHAKITRALGHCRIRVVFYDEREAMVAEWDSSINGIDYKFNEELIDEIITIGPLLLKAGRYWVSVQVHCGHVLSIALWSHKRHALLVHGPAGGFAPYQLRSLCHPQETSSIHPAEICKTL